MTTYNNSPIAFFIDCPLPSLRFCVPETTQENQEAISPSLSNNLHIRLYCNIKHSVLSVDDPNSPTLHVSRYTDTNNDIQSRVNLQDNPSPLRSLINVLSNWKIPEIYYEYIIRETCNKLETVYGGYYPAFPTPFLLGVHVTCHKFYCTNVNAFSQWCRMRWEESRIIRGIYQNDGMIPASESSIQSLVVRKKMSKGEIEEGSSCSICLEEFLEGSVTGCMPCSHIFHEECVTNWLRTSHYCPLCRFEMPTTRVS